MWVKKYLVFLLSSLFFTFSFANFSLVNSEKQSLNDGITSDWFVNGFYIYRDTDGDIWIYGRYKKKLDYDHYTDGGGYMNYYACAWFPFILNGKVYLYVNYKATYFGVPYGKLILYDVSNNSVYKVSDVLPSDSPPCYSSNVGVAYKNGKYYFMDNDSNTIFLEVSTGINFMRFNRDSTYAYLGPYSSGMLFYIGANGSRYMRVSNFGLHIYSGNSLILKNSDLLNPNLAFYSWLFSDLENSYSLYGDRYSDYCIPYGGKKVKCVDVSYFFSPEKLPDNLYYSNIDSVFYALYRSGTTLRVDMYAVPSSDFVSQDAVTSSSVLSGSSSSSIVYSNGSLNFVLFSGSCPVENDSVLNFEIGGWSIFGFKVPSYRPLESYTCLFSILKDFVNPYDLVSFPYLPSYTHTGNYSSLIPDSPTSTNFDIYFGDLLLYFIAVSVWFFYLYKKKEN